MLRRRAMSMVEIVIAMVITGLLASIVLVSYRETLGQTKEQLCRTRMAEVRKGIDAWQLETRRAWFSEAPPRGAPRDPWEHPFQIDPLGGRIWSKGPGSVADHPEDAEALVMEYDRLDLQPEGKPRAEARPAAGGIRVSWTYPQGEQGVVLYRVLRGSDPIQVDTLVGTRDPGEPAEVVDVAPPPGVLHYYQVEAVMAPGTSSGPRRSAPVSSIRVQTGGGPQLQLQLAEAGTAAGVAARVRVSGQGGGVALVQLEFDGETMPVGPGPFELEFPVQTGPGGSGTVTARLIDAEGAVAEETLDLKAPMSLPSLMLQASPATVAVTQPVLVRVLGQRTSAPLARLRFEGGTYSVDPTSFQRDFPMSFANPGPNQVQASLEDEQGGTTSRTLVILVTP